MAERMSAVDASFLHLDEPGTPIHIGSVGIFSYDSEPLSYEQLLSLIRARLPYVPRYRQRLRRVPGGLANPVWVDDAAFDLAYHVRRSALPRPGDDAQLFDLVARIMSRQVDRERPLWEMYLIEGLAGNRFALLTKTHPAAVDGLSALDLGQFILDPVAAPEAGRPDTWHTDREPGDVELVGGVLADVLRRPGMVVDVVRDATSDVRNAAGAVWRGVAGVTSLAGTAVRPVAAGPLQAKVGTARRFAVAELPLADLHTVHAHHGTTINDVALAVVTGALREWLDLRGTRLAPTTTVRALAPVSIRDERRGNALGNVVSPVIVPLPVGESSPVVRLQRVANATRANRGTSPAMGAEALANIAGFAPPTLHALGVRAAADHSARVFNLMVTNVPGPQRRLYAAGFQLLATYPVMPLTPNHPVAIGMTSYEGRVHIGITGDRDAIPDIDYLAAACPQALADLLDTVRAPVTRDDPAAPMRGPRPAAASSSVPPRAG